VSRRRSKSVLGKTRKENADDMPLMITMIGDPEIVRLKWMGVLPADAMASEREALIGDNVHCVAAPDESTEDFHKRLRVLVIAKSSGPPYPSILLGCEQNGKPPMDGLGPPPSRTPVMSLDAAPEGSKLN
jgi:hypothetical protein